MYINNPPQYDIVKWLKDCILGSMRNIKMKCIGAAYLDSRKIMY